MIQNLATQEQINTINTNLSAKLDSDKIIVENKEISFSTNISAKSSYQGSSTLASTKTGYSLASIKYNYCTGTSWTYLVVCPYIYGSLIYLNIFNAHASATINPTKVSLTLLWVKN